MLRVTVSTLKTPIFVRPFSEEEREALQAGLRSNDAFTLRRSKMLLASSRGEYAPKIAYSLGCGQQTVRDAIRDFKTNPWTGSGPATTSAASRISSPRRRVDDPCDDRPNSA